MIRLLVVSHAAVTPVNLSPYACLAARGWEVSVITPARWRSEWGAQPRTPSSQGFPGEVLPIPVRFSGNIPLHHYAAADLSRAFTRVRPDLVYVEEDAHFWSAFQVGRMATAHGIPFALYAAQNLYKRYPWPVARREAWVLAHTRAVVAITADVADVVRRKEPQAPVHQVPLWLVPPQDNDVRHPSPGPGIGEPFTVGYAGRLVPEKGIEILLRGFEGCRIADAVLHIAGSGPLLPLVQATQVRWAERGGPPLRVLGPLPHAEVPRFFAGLDVLVVPSLDTPHWSEQFGRVIIEAAAHGVPSVGSRAGWIPHLLGELGGYCVPQGDAASLAEALRQLRQTWRTPGWYNAAAARRQAARRYSVQAVAAQLSKALQSAVGGGDIA